MTKQNDYRTRVETLSEWIAAKQIDPYTIERAPATVDALLAAVNAPQGATLRQKAEACAWLAGSILAAATVALQRDLKIDYDDALDAVVMRTQAHLLQHVKRHTERRDK
jgi:hypothetical protein